jgi:hypothetical protein
MAVYIELAAGDTLVVGQTRIRLEKKTGQRARLSIDSDDDIERIQAGEAVPPRRSMPRRSTTQNPATAPAAANPKTVPFLRRA